VNIKRPRAQHNHSSGMRSREGNILLKEKKKKETMKQRKQDN